MPTHHADVQNVPNFVFVLLPRNIVQSDIIEYHTFAPQNSICIVTTQMKKYMFCLVQRRFYTNYSIHQKDVYQPEKLYFFKLNTKFTLFLCKISTILCFCVCDKNCIEFGIDFSKTTKSLHNHWLFISRVQCLADPGEARGCSTNSLVINSLID